jgi:hypothetical protein
MEVYIFCLVNAKKVIHTFFSIFFGGAIGALLSLESLRPMLGILSGIFLVITFITGDWKKSLEDKALEHAHNEQDSKLLTQEIEKAKLQEELRKIKGT